MDKNDYLTGLTNKERELVEHLLQGCSNSVIASKMDISLNTVKTHLKHIYSKLEVRNRQQLIVNILT